MKRPHPWNKPIVSLVLAAMAILFISAFAYVLQTPLLYQSQIVVQSQPCQKRSGVDCIDYGARIAYLANYDDVRQAVQHQLSLPNDTLYEISATREAQGIVMIVEAENPVMAQAIANELVHQINVSTEKMRLDSYNHSMDRLSEEVTALESAYPAPKEYLTQSLQPLRKDLNDAKSDKERFLADKSDLYEVLEPATYSGTVVPYWKHLLLTWVYPSALER